MDHVGTLERNDESLDWCQGEWQAGQTESSEKADRAGSDCGKEEGHHDAYDASIVDGGVDISARRSRASDSQPYEQFPYDIVSVP